MEMSLAPLSIPYSDILDEFGLVGDPLALSLLLAAHGVEAAGTKGAGLLPVLRKLGPRCGRCVEIACRRGARDAARTFSLSRPGIVAGGPQNRVRVKGEQT